MAGLRAKELHACANMHKSTGRRLNIAFNDTTQHMLCQPKVRDAALNNHTSEWSSWFLYNTKSLNNVLLM